MLDFAKPKKSVFTGEGRVVDSEADDVYLNLTPMIDVLTTLLFFLLMSFGAVIIALINADVPVQSESEGDQATGKDEVTIGLSITKNGMQLTALNDSLGEAELRALARTFPKKKDYDYKGLHDYLYNLKRRYPKSRSILLTPEKDIAYEVLINTMDASREQEVKVGKRTYRIPIFPQVVVSSIVE